MADVDVNAITGGANRFVPTNPLDTMQKYQNYNNSLVQQAQGIAGIANTQQSTANMAQDNQKTALGIGQNQATYVAQKIAPVLASPDPITQDTVTKIINDARANNAIDDTHVASALKAMPQNGSDADYRKYATQLLIGTLSGPDASSRILPGRVSTDTGDGTQYSTIGGPNQGIGANQVTPSGFTPGGRMGDAQKTDFVTVDRADGGKDIFQRGQLVRHVPAGGAGTGGTPLDGPIPRQPGDDAPVQPNPLLPVVPKGNGLPAPVVSIPAQQATQQADDQKLYQAQIGNINATKQNISDLSEAYNLYKGLSGGKGLEFFNENRSRFVSLGSMLNMDMGSVNNEDARRSLADKLLQRAINNAPGAMRSDAATDAQSHANPNTTTMNRDAALEAIRQNIGTQRQALASALAFTPNTNGVGFSQHNAQFLLNTDRNGFAADHMTAQEFQDRLKSLGGPNSARGREFAVSVLKLQKIYGRGVGESLDANPTVSGGQ